MTRSPILKPSTSDAGADLDASRAMPDESRPGSRIGEPVNSNIYPGFRIQDGLSIDVEPAAPLPARPGRRADHTWFLLQYALIAIDAVLLIAVPLGCHRLTIGTWVLEPQAASFLEVAWLITLSALQALGAFRRPALQRPIIGLNALVRSGIAATLALFTVGFASRWFGDVSRLWVSTAWFASAGALTFVQLMMTLIVARYSQQGLLRERVAIVGAGNPCRDVVALLTTFRPAEVEIIGVFDDRRSRVPRMIGQHRVRGDTDQLVEDARLNGVDRVMLILPWNAEKRILELLGKLRQTPVQIDLVPQRTLWDLASNLPRLHGVPVVTVANDLVGAQLGWLKWVEDVTLGLVFLVMLSPVMALAALAVRLDSPGPILFRQARYGFNNKIFHVYKFRTMRHGADRETIVQQASQDDPRVTRVGRFLRRSSIDELPQLLNVIKGEMSIVGPRPHAVSHNLEYAPMITDYFARHNIKPGITGWAQINGLRGQTETVDKMRRRVELDLDYIRRWSLLFDVEIIILTAFRIWFQKTAY